MHSECSPLGEHKSMRNAHNTVFISKISAICVQAVYFLHLTRRSVIWLMLPATEWWQRYITLSTEFTETTTVDDHDGISKHRLINAYIAYFLQYHTYYWWWLYSGSNRTGQCFLKVLMVQLLTHFRYRKWIPILLSTITCYQKQIF